MPCSLLLGQESNTTLRTQGQQPHSTVRYKWSLRAGLGLESGTSMGFPAAGSEEETKAG